MEQSSGLLDTARAFAAALDVDDYNTARRLLGDDCVYERGDRTFHGIEAIVNSYRDSSAWAKTHLDEIRYESRVRALDDGRIEITFIDHIRVGARKHEYSSRQTLTIDPAGIRRIEHAEIGNQREEVVEFLKQCGIAL